MSTDNDWPDASWETREATLRKTIKRATMDELKQLADKLFPVVTDPWGTRFNDFLKQHGNAEYYRARTPEGAEVIYCRDVGQGIWFLPGSGVGILQQKGLDALRRIAQESADGKSFI